MVQSLRELMQKISAEPNDHVQQHPQTSVDASPDTAVTATGAQSQDDRQIDEPASSMENMEGDVKDTTPDTRISDQAETEQIIDTNAHHAEQPVPRRGIAGYIKGLLRRAVGWLRGKIGF